MDHLYYSKLFKKFFPKLPTQCKVVDTSKEPSNDNSNSYIKMKTVKQSKKSRSTMIKAQKSGKTFKGLCKEVIEGPIKCSEVLSDSESDELAQERRKHQRSMEEKKLMKKREAERVKCRKVLDETQQLMNEPLSRGSESDEDLISI